jgi:hypothetical protein
MNREELRQKIQNSVSKNNMDSPVTVSDVTEEYYKDPGYQGLTNEDSVFSIKGEMIVDFADLIHNFKAEPLNLIANKDGFDLVIVINESA